jgi:hypothetical protein
LDALSQAWLVSCTLLGFPLGLAVWLVEHSLLLSFAVTLGVFALVLNLLRLLNAGSGTAPELALTKGYRPSLTPMIMLLGLALLMSQPAQLLHVSDSARQAVAVHRQQLLLSHRSALSELGQDGEDAFSKEIQECEFVVLRMQRLWDKPQLALLWTLLYVGIAMLPVALARTSYLKAVRAYERVRYRTLGRALRRLDAQAGVAVQAALVRYPSYRRPWPFAPERPLSVHDATPAQGALAVQEREA